MTDADNCTKYVDDREVYIDDRECKYKYSQCESCERRHYSNCKCEEYCVDGSAWTNELRHETCSVCHSGKMIQFKPGKYINGKELPNGGYGLGDYIPEELICNNCGNKECGI